MHGQTTQDKVFCTWFYSDVSRPPSLRASPLGNFALALEMHILPLPEGFAPPDTVRPVGMGFVDKDCTGLGYMPEVARPVAAVGRHWLEVGGCHYL